MESPRGGITIPISQSTPKTELLLGGGPMYSSERLSPPWVLAVSIRLMPTSRARLTTLAVPPASTLHQSCSRLSRFQTPRGLSGQVFDTSIRSSLFTDLSVLAVSIRLMPTSRARLTTLAVPPASTLHQSCSRLSRFQTPRGLSGQVFDTSIRSSLFTDLSVCRRPRDYGGLSRSTAVHWPFRAPKGQVIRFASGQGCDIPAFVGLTGMGTGKNG